MAHRRWSVLAAFTGVSVLAASSTTTCVRRDPRRPCFVARLSCGTLRDPTADCNFYGPIADRANRPANHVCDAPRSFGWRQLGTFWRSTPSRGLILTL